jgi:hypothetical protein
MPRDVSNANQEGLIREPLLDSQHAVDRFVRIGLHFASRPTMVSCEWGIVQAPILQVVKVPK